MKKSDRKGILMVMSNANGWRNPGVFGGAEIKTMSIMDKVEEIDWYILLPSPLFEVFGHKFKVDHLHYRPIATLFLTTNVIKDLVQGLVYTWRCVLIGWKERKNFSLLYSATTNFSDIFPAKIIALITRKPYIAKYHISIYDEPKVFKIYKNFREEKNTRLDSFIRAVLAKVTLGFLKHAKNVLVVCKYLGEQLETCGISKDKIILNYNGLDFVEMGRYKDENIKKQYDICFIGRIEKNKGLEDLIDIIRDLKLQGRNVSAVIIGDGSFFEDLKSMIKSYDLEDLIKITGFLGVERYKLLQESAVFVSPTYAKEGFGLTLLEALFFGVPILAYSHPVFMEVFDQYGSVTLIDQNKSQLKENILNILKNPIKPGVFDIDIYRLRNCVARERDILFHIMR